MTLNVSKKNHITQIKILLLLFMVVCLGPLAHSSNYPLRAGKGSEFEGRYRVWAMASGPMIPLEMRGTTWDGMMHTSDWLPTLVGSYAASGFPLYVPQSPRNLDGLNIWPVLMGKTSHLPAQKSFMQYNIRLSCWNHFHRILCTLPIQT